MAFPAIISSSKVLNGGASGSIFPVYPTVVAGDLLLCAVISGPGNANHTWPANWTAVTWVFQTEPQGGHVLYIAYKIAIGNETGTFQVYFNGNAPTAISYLYRINNWHGTTAPQGGTTFQGAVGTANNFNPPSRTASWGAADTLWLAVASTFNGGTFTGYPSGFTLGQNRDPAGWVLGSMAAKQENAATVDPGTFAGTGTPSFIMQTIAVRPAASLVTPRSHGIIIA